MTEQIYETRVQGMICRRCEDVVSERLMQTRGVIDARASYWKGRLTVTYDPDIVSTEEMESVLEKAGYPAGENGVSGIIVDIICLVAMIGLFFLFKNVKMVTVPKAEAGAKLGFIFVIGLLTSTHCIGMCGGIMLAQTTDTSLTENRDRKRRGFLAALYYNGGRVLTSVVAGALFGAIGAVISYTMTFKSILFTLAGAVVMLIGLNMWGLIPGLRALSPEIPGACELPQKARRRWVGRPLVIGLLTGVMPCGASYAMWVYSMGTGSAGMGAVTMLVWALGTVPLMLLFGSIGAFIPAKYSKWMIKISAMLVAALGMLMLVKGINIAHMLR